MDRVYKIMIYGKECNPINKQAARVTQFSPHLWYEYKRDPGTVITWEAPPSFYSRPPRIFYGENLIGSKRGLMEIIGYYGTNKAQRTSQWVARCRCGKYELRNGKSWRRGMEKDKPDACHRCLQILTKKVS